MEKNLQIAGQNRTAAYLRLSREDADKPESESIKGQRALVSRYVENNPSLRLTAEYADDGYSGTGFERPGFNRMMEDARQGRINCIIVKDLSRLGRNYIETGKYLERILPSMGVRFISVNDNYDSAINSVGFDNVIIPFKNLFNDAYSRDISLKIRSQLDFKRRKGDFVGSFAAYGYKKDRKNHNHLVPDELAAGVVRNMFSWNMDGESCLDIAERLNKSGVLCPMDYKAAQRLGSMGITDGKKSAWTSDKVRRILTNELYAGNMVQGKFRKLSYKIGKTVMSAKEDWIRVENTHEPLIEPEVFLRTQELLALSSRCAKEKGSNIFSGFVFCGGCGKNMVRRGGGKDKKRFYLTCSSFRSHMGCSSHMINETTLCRLTLDAVKSQAQRAAALKSRIESLSPQSKLAAAKKRLKELKSEEERWSLLRDKLAFSLNEKIISPREYEDFYAVFTKGLDSALLATQKAQRELRAFCALSTDDMPFFRLPEEYAGSSELSRRLLAQLISGIEVYDKSSICVHFRFDGEMTRLEEYCAEAEKAEAMAEGGW